MIWLILLFPWLVQAVSLPQPSDVVFIHEDRSEEEQSQYNYIFIIDGDETIYTCQANRCSLLEFREQPTVNANFYELPFGYQRVANVVDQSVLAEYQTAAVATYRFEQLETDLAATSTARSYHTVTIHRDGSYDRDLTSQERTKEDTEAGIPAQRWIWWVIDGVLVALGVGIWVLRKRRK